ncbi:hypothetical protein [Amycolatopsis sp. EV170708-02-1]|uniref:hypothetical protein n=1 Tax=Amycolatopsis sp. EV170708-02-1 TaxID=2919322 RepID=UPI001F0BA95E|nr:hypothetical protein [Amycolatopsis sp. EV170708-02-1]UMP01465.1 hypothetical protein MJQ72_34290 [Amycolatopsis sp. EV170708-02-1]
MTRTTKILLAVTLVFTGLSTGTASADAGCTWTPGTLPLPAGSTTGQVSGAANGGWFVGSGSTTDGVRWHHGTAEILGQAFGRQTILRDINDSGVSVGTTIVDSFENGAVVHRNGRYEQLPVPQGYRAGRAKAINDAGDIVGMASRFADTFDLMLWPASTPGVVRVINPDPAVYSYVSPVDIDEQGRILIRAEGQRLAYFVREAGGSLTELSLKTDRVDAFRGGRISGEIYENGKFVTVEWDTAGRIVRRLDVRARESVVDSGTLTSGTYRTADKRYAVGVWENGALTHTLLTDTDGAFGRPVLTDDGVVTVSYYYTGVIATFTRSCS